MRELVRTTDLYKVDTEAEAVKLIQECKDEQMAGGYELTKYESKYRTKKAKGEIIESWYQVLLQKDFDLGE